MKLRSGRVLNPMPEKLGEEVETKLREFRTLFSGNPQHAQDLLSMIIQCSEPDDCFRSRFIISDKIQEVYRDNDRPIVGIAPLLKASGDLMWLLTGYSDFYKENHIRYNYHDIIQERFELEISLLGDMEERIIEENIL
jgi:hypothetical protein